MPCYHPLTGCRSRITNASGKRSIVFSAGEGYADLPVTIPCGQCIGCRLEKSRQWAIRCLHEASLHKENCFITLTYAPENLPKYGSLDVKDFQDFMKRFRKAAGKKLRFFHCGEYGETGGRPHYHACIFGFDVPRGKLIRVNRHGDELYSSPMLEKLWKKGHSSVGEVTFESAAYVARYITKKVTGKDALEHYNVIDPYGEILEERRPEYVTMSRRPGIAKGWFDKFKGDVFPDDFVVLKKKKGPVRCKPPRFYNSQYELLYPEEYSKIRGRRTREAKRHEHNNSPDRRLVREECHLRRAALLARDYEDETQSV